eukprot:6808165-Prymnesium_polylepis.1
MEASRELAEAEKAEEKQELSAAAREMEMTQKKLEDDQQAQFIADTNFRLSELKETLTTLREAQHAVLNAPAPTPCAPSASSHDAVPAAPATPAAQAASTSRPTTGLRLADVTTPAAPKARGAPP